MLTDTSKWSHARGNEVVPSRWQATQAADLRREKMLAQQLCHWLVRIPSRLAFPDMSN